MPAGRAFSLIPSATGLISRLLLTVPRWATHHASRVCRDVLAASPGNTRFLILCHRAVEPAVHEWVDAAGATDRAEFILASDDMDFSIWAQDAFLAARCNAETGARTCLLTPTAFDRRQDGAVAALLEREAGLAREALDARFEGGNILAGDDVLLVGADDVDRNAGDSAGFAAMAGGRPVHVVASRHPVPEETTLGFEIAGEAWQAVVHRANKSGTRQPLFHIDMFLTLAGRGADGRQRVFVGDIALAARTLGNSRVPEAIQTALDDIAAQLLALDFDVIRNPLPMVYCDQPERRLREWYFASSNNALVQDCADGERIVLLPAYGHGNWPELAATDEANAALWRELGFDVRRIGGCQALAENLGGLHCIAKVLERTHATGLGTSRLSKT